MLRFLRTSNTLTAASMVSNSQWEDYESSLLLQQRLGTTVTFPIYGRFWILSRARRNSRSPPRMSFSRQLPLYFLIISIWISYFIQISGGSIQCRPWVPTCHLVCWWGWAPFHEDDDCVYWILWLRGLQGQGRTASCRPERSHPLSLSFKHWVPWANKWRMGGHCKVYIKDCKSIWVFHVIHSRNGLHEPVDVRCGITGYSPLLDLVPRFDIVYGFPLDEMHSLSLGLTKTMLERLFVEKQDKDTVNIFKKWNQIYKETMTFSEMSRKTRDMQLAKFKASEFKFLHLAMIPVLLLQCISPSYKEHW